MELKHRASPQSCAEAQPETCPSPSWNSNGLATKALKSFTWSIKPSKLYWILLYIKPERNQEHLEQNPHHVPLWEISTVLAKVLASLKIPNVSLDSIEIFDFGGILLAMLGYCLHFAISSNVLFNRNISINSIPSNCPVYLFLFLFVDCLSVYLYTYL